MNNILCPVDFSPPSLMAIEFATKIAAKHGSSIKLLHVFTDREFDESLPETSGKSIEEVSEGIESKLKKLSDEINNMGLQEYPISTYEVSPGDLIETVLNKVDEEQMSMVIMGTNGVADVREADLGSNTERIMELSSVPVLSIPSSASFSGMNKIVYASDYDENDIKVLAKLINYAVPFDSRIYIVHVTNHKKNQEEYLKYTEELKSYLGYDKLSFEQVDSVESTAISIEHTLNKLDANMLVMYRKERGFINSIFHQSLTKKMTYLTNFPLLVLKISE